MWDGRQLHAHGSVVVEDGLWASNRATSDAPNPISALRGHDDPTTGSSAEPSQTPVIDLGRVLLTPGLVNGHAHLELTGVARPPAPPPGDDGFVEWLLEVIARGPRRGEDAAAAALAGLEQSRHDGVYRIHDITRYPREVRRALAGRDVEVISYAEVTGMAARRERAAAMLAAGCDVAGLDRAANLRFGLSPHAPYSTEGAVYACCGRAAAERGWPLMTHLAEVACEREFVSRHTGPLRRLWERLGAWSDDVPPTSLAELLRLCGPGVRIAHGNHLSHDERRQLADNGPAGVIVHCPRTHAYFSRPAFDFEATLACGLRLRLGTDSLASSPDLDMLGELRHLARCCPWLDAPRLWSWVSPNDPRGSVVLAWEVGTTTNPLHDLLAGEAAGQSPKPTEPPRPM